MRKKVFIVLLALVAGLSFCQTKKTVEKPTPQPELRKVEFVPPADSVVTMEQMKKWLVCNSYLDSLSVIYKDSFSVNDAARQARYQEDFLKAQDKICVRAGLTGGYAEYCWILKSIGSPANRKIVDSLKLTTYK
ncbi:MAG TPA: hypothetical protein VLX68_00330 [Chitinivibrionales bacterium]|nr:hypothetical protein [Chitinivibrionales bacterium]